MAVELLSCYGGTVNVIPLRIIPCSSCEQLWGGNIAVAVDCTESKCRYSCPRGRYEEYGKERHSYTHLQQCMLLEVKRSSFTQLLYQLTYSMVQSPSWEANWFVASQEIPRISRNPKVHYRTHKRPPPVPILGQPNPAHIPTSHILEIHPNIMHPSKPRSPQWSLSLRFPHQDQSKHPACACLLT